MRALGYDRYFAQGGDWGSAVTCAIGMNHADRCAGIHVNMVVGAPPPDLMTDLTDAEKTYLARFGWYQAKDNGYSTQQATRPQTIGYGLTDSPAGQMTWIVEKFHGWTDCGHQPGGQSVGGASRKFGVEGCDARHHQPLLADRQRRLISAALLAQFPPVCGGGDPRAHGL